MQFTVQKSTFLVSVHFIHCGALNSSLVGLPQERFQWTLAHVNNTASDKCIFFISVSISDLSAALFLTPEAWRKLKKLWWKSQIPSIPKSTLAILSPAFTRRAATWWTCGVYRRIFKSFVPFATEAHWGPLFSDEKVHIPIEQCLQCFWIINQEGQNKGETKPFHFYKSLLCPFCFLTVYWMKYS